jgi:hypothetical protein
MTDDLDEEAYCKRLSEMLLEYELDPRNFTKVMRAHKPTPSGPRHRFFTPVRYNSSSSDL